jgi:hypothetical protein
LSRADTIRTEHPSIGASKVPPRSPSIHPFVPKWPNPTARMGLKGEHDGEAQQTGGRVGEAHLRMELGSPASTAPISRQAAGSNIARREDEGDNHLESRL